MVFKKGHQTWNKGKSPSEETKRKSSIAHLGKPSKRKGMKLPEWWKAKLHKSHKSMSLQGRKNISIARTGMKVNISEQAKINMSIGQLGKKYSVETCLKRSIARKGIPISEQHKQKVREARLRDWQNPEYAKRMFKMLIKRPTKLETQFTEFLQANKLPYKYVGNGEVIIGSKNPDYINVNGEKKLIELFSYHHRNPKLWHQTEEGCKEYYSRYGFETIVVWDNELKDKEQLLKKLEHKQDNIKAIR